jgi:hypothetical protein
MGIGGIFLRIIGFFFFYLFAIIRSVFLKEKIYTIKQFWKLSHRGKYSILTDRSAQMFAGFVAILIFILITHIYKL